MAEICEFIRVFDEVTARAARQAAGTSKEGASLVYRNKYLANEAHCGQFRQGAIAEDLMSGMFCAAMAGYVDP